MTTLPTTISAGSSGHLNHHDLLHAEYDLRLHEVFRPESYGAAADGTTDDTTAIQSAVTAANAANGTVLFSAATYKIAGTVSLTTPTNRYLRLLGQGKGTVILDANTTGPIFKYQGAYTNGNRFAVEDLDVHVTVNKAGQDVFQFLDMGTANFRVRGVHCDGAINAFVYRYVFYLKNCWEGSFEDITMSQLQGGSFYVDDPDANGGNITFKDVFHYGCAGPFYMKGNQTTNNVKLLNVKWVGPLSYQMYLTRTTSLPAVGASTITLPTGIAANYFTSNQAVVLLSNAGMEVVHMNGYVSGTGVLTIRETIALNHAATGDLRIITATSMGVITDFLTPMLDIDCCHWEATTNVIKDAPGTHFHNCIFSLNYQAIQNGPAIGTFICGTQNEEIRFTNSMLMQPGSIVSNTMVFVPYPTGYSQGPSVRIDGVATYTINQADQSGTAMKPLDGDSTFNLYGVYEVMTNAYKGPQATTLPLRAGNASNNGAGNGSARMWGGSGVPSSSLGANGDYYLRTDGSSSTTHLYFKAAGAWSGIA